MYTEVEEVKEKVVRDWPKRENCLCFFPEKVCDSAEELQGTPESYSSTFLARSEQRCSDSHIRDVTAASRCDRCAKPRL